jgi:hypothetical protein
MSHHTTPVQNSDSHSHHHHEGSFTSELMHHLPYAIFSVAVGMMILSLLDYTSGWASLGELDRKAANNGYHMLFHSFHFLHILFAATGTIITFSRFSNSFVKALIVGIISPAIFCILSDVLLPYLAGRALGIDMELHICFHKEFANVLPFLGMGVLNGMVLRQHHSAMLSVFSLGSHIAHILISSLAGLFYMVSHGLDNWYPQMGMVFLFLVIAVVIPCTLSDVVVPMYWAGVKPKKA